MTYDFAKASSNQQLNVSNSLTAVRRFARVFCLLFALQANASPIAEIMSLPAGARLPESILDRYDSRSIAESIVLRKVRDEGNSQDESKYDFGRDTEIHLYFNSTYIDSIKNNGFFNIFQSAVNYRKVARPIATVPGYVARGEVESIVTGLDFGLEKDEVYETKLSAVRPKSAALLIPWNEDFGALHSGLAGYGDVVAVLKNEVKKRALWTNGDSLEMKRDPKISVRSFDFKADIPTKAYGYYEALIFGELNATDVREFRVPSDFPSEKLEKLKQLGISIYEYIEVDKRFVSEEEAARTGEKVNFRRIRGKLIYQANSRSLVVKCSEVFRVD